MDHFFFIAYHSYFLDTISFFSLDEKNVFGFKQILIIMIHKLCFHWLSVHVADILQTNVNNYFMLTLRDKLEVFLCV